ncbi:CPBP family intramembrane metalloprotease [Rhodococcus hoagii]|nr:CPBP family intramembrane metalloprotease [Prescottella equi]NKS71645.1 CPBP family intramembrane metalloprotease [Prescottella equi]
MTAPIFAGFFWVLAGRDVRVGGPGRWISRAPQPRRITLARIRWLLRAAVWGPPGAGSVWAWTRALVAAAVLTVLLRTVIDPAVVSFVAEPLTSEQAARYAHRATWILEWGWPASIPGLTVVSAAAGEEILFRAPLLILAACLARRSRVTYTHRTRFVQISILVVGVMISTTLFGLAHADYSVSNVVTAAANGFFWALLALRTKSLIPSIASHTTVNLLVLY